MTVDFAEMVGWEVADVDIQYQQKLGDEPTTMWVRYIYMCVHTHTYIYIHIVWWFGTFGLFFNILGIKIPTGFHIFQRD